MLYFSDINAQNNVYGVAIVQDETVFPSTKVECVGQIIGVIIAKDQATAQRAAKMVWLIISHYQSNALFVFFYSRKYFHLFHNFQVVVKYQELPAILTMEDAIASKSFHKFRVSCILYFVTAI